MSEIDKVKAFCLDNYFLEKSWHKLKKNGHDYLVKICDHFDGTTEQDFNSWVFGRGDHLRPKDPKQETLVASIFVQYLQWRTRNGQRTEG